MASKGLHRFAVLTALATLGLIGVGGLVTSHGAGMAVPDWPNTYGYNMFCFPISQWVGGIFYEHTHRLVASAVGLLTVVLTLWLHGTSARPFMRWGGWLLLLLGVAIAIALPPRRVDGLVVGLTGLASLSASWVWPRCQPSPKWLRWCGLVALLAVILQGVLGGLRVVLLQDALGIVHATLAQLFLVLLCAIALFTSRWWQTAPVRVPPAAGHQLPTLFLFATLLILAQLTLGAVMRHQHAGLAIPDFPLAYGKLWPDMDSESVARYNAQRLEILAVNPITAFQIALQMIHRLLAVLILGAVAFAAWSARRALGAGHCLSRLGLVWLGLILAQVLLGAITIWSDKAADIATAHVLVGALSLALGALISMSLVAASRQNGADYRIANQRPAAESRLRSEPQPSASAGAA
ncbi:MAG TPA: COX15/CtaA family protein [Candidatus Paceibacterota bacterium]|nr:COX15/CtaA family protein [Verrucomicrobiota bacterium]HSA11032.1 COX15/CtaA family protein [Candidatus Paceibacterota bacterium]